MHVQICATPKLINLCVGTDYIWEGSTCLYKKKLMYVQICGTFKLIYVQI